MLQHMLSSTAQSHTVLAADALLLLLLTLFSDVAG
jgi:hypothetical protein